MEGSPSVPPLAVAVHLVGVTVRGLAPLGRLRRLLDLLNQPSLAFVGLTDPEVYAPASRTWEPVGAHVSINKHEILFAYPLERGAAQTPGLQVEKFPVRVGLYAADYRLQGSLHLLDRVPWEDLLTGLRDRFLPLTDVTVSGPSHNAEPLAHEFVAVNRERVSLLHEIERAR